MKVHRGPVSAQTTLLAPVGPRHWRELKYFRGGIPKNRQGSGQECHCLSLKLASLIFLTSKSSFPSNMYIILYILFYKHINRYCKRCGILGKTKVENIGLNKLKHVSFRVKFSICVILNVLQTSPEDREYNLRNYMPCGRLFNKWV